MKVEYLNDMTDGGKYKQVVSENLIRLYDFDTNQTTKFAKLVFQTLIVDKQKLDLSSIQFIEPSTVNWFFNFHWSTRGF